MPKICYVQRRFSPGSLALIEQANDIIADYEDQGYTLTLRQLYYQFVSRDLIANKQTEYKRLGSVINDARLAGLVDWEAIEDRTRGLEALAHWGDPAVLVEACAEQYRNDKWESQPTRVEVWVEKEALAGIFASVCERFDVPYLSCRGYTSASEMWRAAERLKSYERAGQHVYILHFGDHDPSGMDMTRDIRDRLRIFGCDASVTRLALNMDQVRQYNPPPNPAKLTDARAPDYIQRYGESSWELDALEPRVLVRLVEQGINARLDSQEWERAERREAAGRRQLADVAEQWEAIVSDL